MCSRIIAAALMIILPLPSKAGGEASVLQNIAITLLDATKAVDLTESDKSFILESLSASKGPEWTWLREEAQVRLQQLKGRATEIPFTQATEPTYTTATVPPEQSEQSSTVDPRSTPHTNETDQAPVRCQEEKEPTTETCNGLSQLAIGFERLRHIADRRSKLPRDHWIRLVQNLDSTFQGKLLRRDVLRLRVFTAALLAAEAPREALKTMEKIDSDYAAVWDERFLRSYLEALDPSLLDDDDQIAIECFTHYLRGHFAEAADGLRALRHYHLADLNELIKRVPNRRVQLAFYILLFANGS